jgi:hypothetical protein
MKRDEARHLGWVGIAAILAASLATPSVWAADTAAPAKTQAAKQAPVRVTDVSAATSAEPASSTEGNEVKLEKGTVSGRISTVTKRAIAVEFTKGDEKEGEFNEMLLPLAENVLVGPKTLVAHPSELKYGDHVKVGYERKYRINDKGEKIAMGTLAKVIHLVERPKPSTAVPAKQEAVQ